MRAATRLGVEVVVGSDVMPILMEGATERAVVVPLDEPEVAADLIVALDDRRGVDAVVAVDDRGVLVAAAAGERLGFPHNPPDAVAATRDKAAMRRALGAAEVPQPAFVVMDDELPEMAFPWVLKPLHRSGSQGVIRADDIDSARAAVTRIRAIADGPLLVEQYVPGVEIAVEGLLSDGELTVLAVFDKPDPLEGPYFEETIYITPSRLPAEALARAEIVTASACAAIGLVEGPVHAELRVSGDRVHVIEVAARSIGGLCARTLRFGAGIALEELVLRHALGLPLDGLEREAGASGVMMLPIPRGNVARGRRSGRGACSPRGHRPRHHHPARSTGGAAARGRPLPWVPVRPRHDPCRRGACAARRPRGPGHRHQRRRHLMKYLLVATYELGQQPGAVGSAAAHLRAEGHEVQAIDVSVDAWDPALVEWADEVAFSVPMHTATRLARDLAASIDKPIRVFGLYAEQCHDFATPVAWDASLPARDLLPPLERYARLEMGGEAQLVGSVLASHGCAHRCRHCPVPVVFDGRVRRVEEDAVLADIAQLVAAGARHITFGDPDFLNAPPHSRRIVAAMHERFPEITFDCTVKVEHVLRYSDVWPEFAAAGCVFVVSAFESVDDAVLVRLDKGHTTTDAARAVAILRDAGIEVRPSWMPFTPWATRDDVIALLDFVHEHDLVGSVDPVQYSVRLLLPEGSLLLDHPDLVPFVGPWDPERSTYTWAHPDPAVDELQQSHRRHRRQRRRPDRALRPSPRRGRRPPGGSRAGHDRSTTPERELVLLFRADRRAVVVGRLGHNAVKQGGAAAPEPRATGSLELEPRSQGRAVTESQHEIATTGP